MDKNQLYQDLYSNYKKANPYKRGIDVQKFVVKFWNNAKKETNFLELVTNKIDECKDKQLQYKQTYFTAGSSRNDNDEQIDGPDSTTKEVVVLENIPVKVELKEEDVMPEYIPVKVELQEDNAWLNLFAESMNDHSNESTPWDTKKSDSEAFATPAQDKLQQEIDSLNIEIEAMVTEKENGVRDGGFEKRLQSKCTSLETKKTKLYKMKEKNLRKRKSRLEFKKKLAYIYEHIPEARAVLQMKNFGQQQ